MSTQLLPPRLPRELPPLREPEERELPPELREEDEPERLEPDEPELRERLAPDDERELCPELREDPDDPALGVGVWLRERDPELDERLRDEPADGVRGTYRGCCWSEREPLLD